MVLLPDPRGSAGQQTDDMAILPEPGNVLTLEKHNQVITKIYWVITVLSFEKVIT